MGPVLGLPFLRIIVRGEARNDTFCTKRRYTLNSLIKPRNCVAVVGGIFSLVGPIFFEDTLNLPGRIMRPRCATDYCIKNYFSRFNGKQVFKSNCRIFEACFSFVRMVEGKMIISSIVKYISTDLHLIGAMRM